MLTLPDDPRKRLLLQYAVVLGSVQAALWVRVLVNELLHRNYAFLTFFPAIAVSAWFAGGRGGLVATILSATIVFSGLWSPSATASGGAIDVYTITLFCMIGCLISVLGRAQHLAQNRLADQITLANDNLLLARQSEAEARASAVALKNTQDQLHRLLDREHNVAIKLQRSLLQLSPVELSDQIVFETCYLPALGDLEVGGDFIDVFKLDDQRFACVVGDISGKGLEAAAKTSEVKFTLRAYAHEFRDPARVLTKLNAMLTRVHEMEGDEATGFVCLTIAVIDTSLGEISLAQAGAEPALLLRSGGEIVELHESGIPLAVMPEANYTNTSTRLSRGDVLMIMTDGITEARQDRICFGTEGVREAIINYLPYKDLTSLTNSVVDSARSFGNGQFNDDVAIVVVGLK